MSHNVFSLLSQACSGESKGPCRPGFSQTSYSWLIPRDVLQGQSILEGKVSNEAFTHRGKMYLCFKASGGGRWAVGGGRWWLVVGGDVCASVRLDVFFL
uniref:Uncharacterized protein n=1 Tax=Esox lucius TaxID=8010 RepID=A0AAY5L3U3_ESOLU